MVHLVYDSAHRLLGQEDFISDRDKVDGKSLCNCVLRTWIDRAWRGESLLKMGLCYWRVYVQVHAHMYVHMHVKSKGPC